MQVHAVGIGHRRTEIVRRHCLPVVALEVQIHTLAESLATQHRLIHAYDLGTFLVYRDGVEIVDLDVSLGTNRVRHRARILGELHRTQHAHVVNTLDRRRSHVGTEFLVPEHGQPFFQAQLEPVAAGNPVAGPVVKIFMRDDTFNSLVIGIGCGLRFCEDIGRVENIQALVFHRAHVEVTDGNDHVDIQVVFETESLLVPLHRVFQRIHGMSRLVEIPRFNKQLKCYFAPGSSGVPVFETVEIAGNQRKQVRRLLEGVLPGRKVLSAIEIALFDQVTVG